MDGKLWPAYILHSRPFQEDKLLLQLLLPEQGRIDAVIRKRQGKQYRSLQPFQLFSIALVGRGSLKNVRQLEEQHPAHQLSGKVLFSGLYINELICRLWPTDTAAEQLFTSYEMALQSLALAQHASEQLEPCLRQFEFSLLAELGVLPDWDYDALQQGLQAEQYYYYAPEHGFMPISQQTPYPKHAWQGRQLWAIAAQQWHEPETLLAAKLLSRHLFAPLLGNKPLASRALFNQLEKMNPSPASPQS